jgi:uncharacterized protein
MSDMTDAHLDFADEITRVYPDAWTRHFWDAAREHRLVVARCKVCGADRMPPTPFCWQCRSQDTEWVELPGTGTVYTFTIARHALTPATENALPYVIAVIALDGTEGARLISNVVGITPDDVAIGMPVEVVYDDVSPDVTIPRFQPLAGSDLAPI